jgi:hypothetical protein
MIATDAEDLLLPPLFSLRRVDASPFAAACARAAEAGAGALFLREGPGLLALALVLEPEEPLREARRAFHVCMAALSDALAALCLPERAVEIVWPDVVACDGGRIGGGRLGWPEAADEAAAPPWLVFGADLIRDRDALAEPGRFPETTSLKEEGFESTREVVESFSRNLMRRFDLWEAQGFAAATEGYLRRLAPDGTAGPRRIGPEGDLEAPAADGAARTRSLVAALAAPAWFDPARGGPRL